MLASVVCKVGLGLGGSCLARSGVSCAWCSSFSVLVMGVEEVRELELDISFNKVILSAPGLWLLGVSDKFPWRKMENEDFGTSYSDK